MSNSWENKQSKRISRGGWRRSVGRTLKIVGCVVTASAIIGMMKIGPIYEATARILFESNDIDFLADGTPKVGSYEEEMLYLQTAYRNLLSRSLVEQVINRLRLQEDRRYAGRVDLVPAVMHDITIAPIPSSRLVDVKVRHPDPRVAANIANSLVNDFQERSYDRQRSRQLDQSRQLTNETRILGSKLEYAEKQLASFCSMRKFTIATMNPYGEAAVRAEMRLVEAKRRSSNLLNELNRLSSASTNLLSRASNATAQSSTQPRTADSGPDADHGVSALAGVEPSGGQSVHVTNTIEGTASRADRSERLQNLTTEYTDSLESVRQQEESWQEWLNRAAQWDKLRVEYDVLALPIESTKGLYRTLLAKEAALSGKTITQNIAIIDRASMPLRPLPPTRWVIQFWLGVFLFVTGFITKPGPPANSQRVEVPATNPVMIG